MLNPAPINSPFFLGVPKSRLDSPPWVEWFQRFWDYYDQVLQWTDPGSPYFGKAAPSAPVAGLMAYADGSSWNPGGTGAGYYRYDGANWVKVG